MNIQFLKEVDGCQVIDLHAYCASNLLEHRKKENWPSWCIPRKVKNALRWLTQYDKITKGHARAGINC